MTVDTALFIVTYTTIFVGDPERAGPQPRQLERGAADR